MKNPVNYYFFEHEGEFTSTMVLSATPADMINALVTGSLEKKSPGVCHMDDNIYLFE